MTTISDSDLATLRAKFELVASDKDAANAATANRIATGTAADAADATYHQAQLDEVSADATEAADFLNLRTFVDSLFDVTPPVDPPVDPPTTDELSPVTPITASTTDLAVLYTVPAGPSIRIMKCQLEVQTPFSPTAAILGVSSTNPNSSTPGDLLSAVGVPGPKVGQAVLSPGDNIIWNVTAPGFTSGQAILHISAVNVDPVDVPPSPAPAFARARR
jgi:hypothetical protein